MTFGVWIPGSSLFHETSSPSHFGDLFRSLCDVLVQSALASDSTMCSGGKYCVLLFLLESILSDPGTTNQGERKERDCIPPHRLRTKRWTHQMSPFLKSYSNINRFSARPHYARATRQVTLRFAVRLIYCLHP